MTTISRRSALGGVAAIAAALSASLFAPAPVRSAAADDAGRPLLRVGSQLGYEPFEFLDSETGEPKGFDIDLIEEIARRIGRRVEIVPCELSELIAAIERGEIDCVISAFTITSDRLKRVAFSKPYMNAGLSVMTRPETAPRIRTIQDLKNRPLCVEEGSSSEALVKRIPGARLLTFRTVAEAFAAVDRGECYAAVNVLPSNRHFLRTPAAKVLSLEALDFVLSDDFYGIAVGRGDPQLLVAIDRALDDMRADGSFSELHIKWFGEPAR